MKSGGTSVPILICVALLGGGVGGTSHPRLV